MNTKTNFIVVAVGGALISFLLSRVIWPDAPGMIGPEAGLVPGFIFISALESIAFGVGLAFLAFGFPMVKKIVGDDKKGAVLSLIAIAWTLVSWWPHDNMHRVNDMSDFGGLLRIEFIFHFTLIIAGFILAYYFWKRIAPKKA